MICRLKPYHRASLLLQACNYACIFIIALASRLNAHLPILSEYWRGLKDWTGVALQLLRRLELMAAAHRSLRPRGSCRLLTGSLYFLSLDSLRWISLL